MAYLKNIDFVKLLQNKKMIQLLDEVKYNSMDLENPNNAAIVHMLNHLKYNNSLTIDNEKEIFSLIPKIINELEDSNKENKIITNIILGLSSQNKEIFLDNLILYINRFLEKNKQSQRSINEMFLEDKIEIFYSNNFAKQQNVWNKSLIELIITHYNKDIFFTFMEIYKIPFNIPICKEIKSSNSEEIVITYQSLYEYGIENNINLAKDLIENNIDIWKIFEHKLVLNDKIYNYVYNPFILSNMYDQHTIIKMINHKTITKTTCFNNQNIFYTLLSKEYSYAFFQLYELTKKEDVEFSLKSLSEENKEIDIISFYLKNKTTTTIDPMIMDIFVKEKIDLNFEYGQEKTAIQNLMITQNLSEVEEKKILIQNIYLVKELINNDFKNRQLLSKVLTSEEIESKIIENETEMACWYDINKLSIHLKNSTGNRTKLLEKILNENKPKKPILKIKNEDFFNELEKKQPNFKEIIEYYKGQFRQNYYGNKKRINPILLLGEPGIGKTYFSKQLAKELHTGYEFIDMASLSAGWILTGMNGTWQDAKQGKILDTMLKSPTFNPVVLLDEIDKTNNNKYDVLSPLYQLLEEVNAKEFVDEYLDFKFDVSGIIYIACANSIQKLSEPILSRFKVFHVPTPTEEQLNLIIKNIYRESINNNPILNPHLDENLIKWLKNNSLREIKILLEEAISNLLLEKTREDLDDIVKNNKVITLKEENFRNKKLINKFGF